MIVALMLLTASYTPETREVERVRAHLQRAEQTLAARDTSHLPPQVQARRAKLVERLAAYRAAGRFPTNDDSWIMRPTFVDDDGVRCAMAELIHSTSATELVDKVASERNHAFVRELVDDPDLVRWLDEHGLTVAEAARIQPSYCRVRGDTLCQDEMTGVAFAQPMDAEGTQVVIRQAFGDTGEDGEGTAFDVDTFFWDRFQPSLGLVVLYRDGQRHNFMPLDHEGVRSAGDILCSDAPRVPMETFPSLLLDPDVDCRDRLALIDPRFAGSICDGLPACPAPAVPDPFEPWPAEEPTHEGPSDRLPDTAATSEDGGCTAASGVGVGAWTLLLLAAGRWRRRNR